MINNQEEDEFVAVRVQDPRIQNEGSWNSYVDYKIFLHTNSKAFTAKTSCVRRRYSEFSWLKKKLQKNAGLVPVPDLPGKSFFSFINEDFLEGRRKGLQSFLDKVVHMTVCLSDSQLHLFLQTQLPIGHIQDCVQGHTPYSVTDAILTYASSNQGFAQAQEDDAMKEPSLTVSYESMDSPVPHQPCLQTPDGSGLQLGPGPDPNPPAGLQAEDQPTVRVLQKNNQLEAVVEASFFLGDQPESETQIQTPVEVHCREEEEETLHQQEESEEATAEIDTVSPDDDAGPEEDLVDQVCSEVPEENGLDHVEGTEDVKSCDGLETKLEHDEDPDQTEPDRDVDLSGTKDESDDNDDGQSSNESIVKVSDEESVCDEAALSMPPVNGFLEASQEEEEEEEEEVGLSRTLLDLHLNGCPVGEEEETSDWSKSVDLNSTGAAGDLTENSDFSVIETSCSPGGAQRLSPEA
ncbi:uncharacterized protein V6R79_025567 [Siganus canaliculatus]